MPLRVNLRQLQAEPQELSGKLPPSELGLEGLDESLLLNCPLLYELTATFMDDAILVQGSLQLPMECECVRCLKRFPFTLELPDFAAHLPLAGEEAVPVADDSVDLTPFLREDILLTLPQHPLCKPDCRGLSQLAAGGASGLTSQTNAGPSPWSVLNELKLKE
jgi:uncharacterized protein